MYFIWTFNDWKQLTFSVNQHQITNKVILNINEFTIISNISNVIAPNKYLFWRNIFIGFRMFLSFIQENWMLIKMSHDSWNCCEAAKSFGDKNVKSSCYSSIVFRLLLDTLRYILQLQYHIRTKENWW